MRRTKVRRRGRSHRGAGTSPRAAIPQPIIHTESRGPARGTSRLPQQSGVRYFSTRAARGRVGSACIQTTIASGQRTARSAASSSAESSFSAAKARSTTRTPGLLPEARVTRKAPERQAAEHRAEERARAAALGATLGTDDAAAGNSGGSGGASGGATGEGGGTSGGATGEGTTPAECEACNAGGSCAGEHTPGALRQRHLGSRR